jgi:hypothetical protein
MTGLMKLSTLHQSDREEPAGLAPLRNPVRDVKVKRA